ncbi:aminopeptidase [Noviherbaspirillum sp. UKPF54]|uniref:aminopeptidase n=1 Tax=Noviherbaspirillum sp. UKPF54 TaxID=2601898 RepID=UPI0011B13941|nr:aminopeptidase [Noviherbaspirillum sp. UKPF54]QDZ30276.1 aminopeptidase [Noviherbaspirillum sp. UKPF54]
MKIKWRALVFCGVAALVGGCSQMGYFVQAAQGQFSLLAEAQPIDDWLARSDLNDTLRDKLTKVKEIRAFAAKELALPDNDTFTTYADLKRPFVMWNVVATPELSLKPLQWCFPVAGCVNYRGYYSKDDAQSYAKELRAEHYDVEVSGVPAYSTLGWFRDPVLSTFIKYPDGEVARMVFHELAHQVVYVPGDSRFNESFAVAVEEAGVERWLAMYGNDKMRKTYAEYEGRKRDFLALLMKHRKALEENYKRDASDTDKRKEKAAIFQSLKDDYQALKASWGGYSGYDRWFAEPLSNAHLSAIATYHDFVPGFKALLMQQKRFDKFYQAVKRLASLDENERHRQLAAMSPPPTMAAGPDGAEAMPVRLDAKPEQAAAQ